jgi:hypothetical protein
MARIEITLTSSYVRNWGVWEGLRELFQNAVDGQTEGYPMSIRRTEGNSLIIENEGGSLPRESLELSSLAGTIEVLVHEYCHKTGPDGDKKFHDAIAATMARIIASLV